MAKFTLPRHLFTKLKNTEEFKQLAVYDATVIIDTYAAAAFIGFTHRTEEQRLRAVSLLERSGLKPISKPHIGAEKKTMATVAIVQFMGTEELAQALNLPEVGVTQAEIEHTPEVLKLIREASDRLVRDKVQAATEKKNYLGHLKGMAESYIIDAGDAGVIPAFVEELDGELMLKLTPVPHIWACFTFQEEPEWQHIAKTFQETGILVGGSRTSTNPAYPSVIVGLLGFCSEPGNLSGKSLENLGRAAAEEYYRLNCELFEEGEDLN